MISWLGLQEVVPTQWADLQSVKVWWDVVAHKKGHSRKAMTSLAMLVSWEIWQERNARVFRNVASTAQMVIMKIKSETRMWSLARAKALSYVIPGE